MTMGERIKAAIAEKARTKGTPYSQSELARAVGVTPQTVQQWASGYTSPRRARIKAIAEELKCDAVWLETGSNSYNAGGPPVASKIVGRQIRAGKDKAETHDRHTVAVRYYPKIEASAGHGCVPVDEATIAMVEMARAVLRKHNVNPADAALLQANGDSMRGTVEHGDMMLLNLADREPQDGRVYVVSVRNTTLVKRIQWIPGGVNLIADNPAYEPIRVLDEDQDTDIAVVGRVVMAWHPHVLLA